MFPFFLITLGNRGYQLLQFSIVAAYKTYSCSTVCARRSLILLFMMDHTFSIGDRTGLLAGQSSTSTVSMKPCSFSMCKMRPSIVLLKYPQISQEKTLMAACVSIKSQYNLLRRWYLHTYASHRWRER